MKKIEVGQIWKSETEYFLIKGINNITNVATTSCISINSAGFYINNSSFENSKVSYRFLFDIEKMRLFKPAKNKVGQIWERALWADLWGDKSFRIRLISETKSVLVKFSYGSWNLNSYSFGDIFNTSPSDLGSQHYGLISEEPQCYNCLCVNSIYYLPLESGIINKCFVCRKYEI